jgi:putative acetyltransferase
MQKIIRTTATNEDFRNLVAQLDHYLAVIDGNEHDFYHQFNKIENLNQVIVIYEDDIAIACGAIKELDTDSMEVKRMFTDPAHRGKGLARQVLSELEKWAAELGYRKCLLETGKRMEDAIALYTRNKYQVIPNYGQYIGVDNSVCFQKVL